MTPVPLPIVARLRQYAADEPQAVPPAADERAVLREAAALIEVLARALEAARIAHHISEDCWYSCPMAREDGSEACCNDNLEERCNCGADSHNAAIAAALTRARQEMP